ncbi:hypothetical protein OH799_22895 [Nocardia sp. NBC_00881]|uniref:hypothetical protein n=1 Tax=Nocardia sp. NBC_00881 TaxID=2975995 RepID=UPI00387083B6|nr:hypothetical protein OH799_22895 [Nocardia sp. NBC_00881]
MSVDPRGSITIDRLDVLDAMPPGAMISDHGRVAVRTPMGIWAHSDGQRWEPSVPVQFIKILGR